MTNSVCDTSHDTPVTGLTRPATAKSGQVGIGITTRDRWEDIAVTLSELHKQGYEELEIIVIDDGSQQPLPEDLRIKFPKVRFERVDHSLGLVVQRNRLARMLNSTYYLSLDDDSFPVAGDIGKAVIWLEDHPSVVALALHIVRRNDPVPSIDELGEPYPVRYYTGCGHLLRRELFLKLGGYLERLHYFCEEVEFCLKALGQGFSTYAYPGVVVRHNLTLVARNSRKASRFYIRNETIVGLLYFPFPFSILRAVSCLRVLRDPVCNRHPGIQVVAWLEAVLFSFRLLKWRRPLSFAQLRAWKRLPLP
jgi:GT2 family glycosyltransferase